MRPLPNNNEQVRANAMRFFLLLNLLKWKKTKKARGIKCKVLAKKENRYCKELET